MDGLPSSETESVADTRKSGGTLLGSRFTLENSHHQPSLKDDDDGGSSSDFGERECGEPLLAQHLIIDFTIDEELDNEYSQKKCCAFWEFINSHPELSHLCVMPDTNESMDSPEECSETVDSSVSRAEGDPEPIDKTAVSMLSLVEHKGLIDRAFEPKVCQSHCTLGSREYIENESTKPVPLKKRVCTCTAPCIKPCKPGAVTRGPSTTDALPDVQELCHTLEDWDLKHPKSMESPGPSPDLIHAVMQRKIEPFC